MALRVLHIVQSLEPGGMENGIINMVNLLSGDELSFDVCCMTEAGRMAKRLPQGCQLHVLGKSSGLDLSLPRKLKDLLEAVNPDILHTHNLGPLIYSCIACLFRAPYRILHGEHASLTRTDLRLRKRIQRKLFYRFCTRIHTVGWAMTRQLDGLRLSSQSILTLQNGVDTDRFIPAKGKVSQREKLLGLGADIQLVGIFGRFGPYKRHDYLLNAFADIAVRCPNLHLLVAGGGGELEDDIIAKIQKHSHGHRIHALGFLEDPLSYYQCLDLLVIPSANEGLSNCALEAMSCGVPVLSNLNCGSEELITDGQDGIIREINSPDALARYLTWLFGFDGPNLQTLGANARQKIQKQFSLGVMANAYLNTYRAL